MTHGAQATRPERRPATLRIAAMLATIVSLLALPNGARAGASGDFNGDGRMDIAIGVPGEDLGGIAFGAPGNPGGAVHVLYGSRNGITEVDDKLWAQSTPGVAGESEAGDGFGVAVAAGDFDDDGWSDLAIGVPGENDHGFVNVLYGSSAGLSATDNQLWSQGSAGVPGAPQDGDGFGGALAIGDFNGDDFDDLAVGVSSEDSNGLLETDTGAVNVFYGSRSGLTATSSQLWSQDSSGVKGSCENNDTLNLPEFDASFRGHDEQFGHALAAGDFNDDGHDDLAIGVPGETLEFDPLFSGRLEDLDQAGAVNVLYGSPAGLTADGDQLFAAETGFFGHDHTYYGSALAAGDFDDDGREDLAIGVPGYDVADRDFAGAVHVLSGSSSGLTTNGEKLWFQDSSGIAGLSEPGDAFGDSLSAGDFNGDGRDDLAIGVPSEDIGSLQSAGVVNVLYGSGEGLTSNGNQMWAQDQPGIAEHPEGFDGFGKSLWAGDFDLDGRSDLVIGVPSESIIPAFSSSKVNCGAAHVLYGTYVGLSATRSQLWHQDTAGVVDLCESGDGFGR